MKPYGITLDDRRPMYDYRSDKFNSRGCLNDCNCNVCMRKGRKHKIRKDDARTKTSKLSTKNRMRTPKKRERQEAKRIIKNSI